MMNSIINCTDHSNYILIKETFCFNLIMNILMKILNKKNLFRFKV